jgi:hypothetical protein
MDRMRALVSAGLLCALLAGQLPVPSAAERAGAHERLLQTLARLLPDADAVCRLAQDEAQPAAVRFELFVHAERVACAAGDVAAGLRVADACSAVFAVGRDAARADCLARFEAAGAAAPPALAGARLLEAERTLEGDGTWFAAHLARARELAHEDAPAVSGAHVEWEATLLAQARAAYEDSIGANFTPAARARFLAFYRGRFDEALAGLRQSDDRAARIAGDKIRGRQMPADMTALTQQAEEWLSLSRSQAHALAQRHLCLRARSLLAPCVFDALATGMMEGDVDALARTRLRTVFERATDLSIATFAPALRQWRFTAPADGERLLISGGEWRVADGVLLGHNDGEKTRATARVAWRRIDSVTIRGGIRSPAGLNFRVAIGDFNALFNWEVADENHFYYRDAGIVVAPRRLRRGEEHTLRVHQLGEQIVATVDGDFVAAMPGKLDGTVTVYPAVGSTIFVRSIDVLGEVDLGRGVTGHVGTARW